MWYTCCYFRSGGREGTEEKVGAEKGRILEYLIVEIESMTIPVHDILRI